ncbi:MAG: hypothetical protein ACPGVU_26430 [Limisphaerales bacterium]
MKEPAHPEVSLRGDPPLGNEDIRRRALMWHSLGFATLVLLLWADELFTFLYGYFQGDWRRVDLFEAAIRTGVIILLWIISSYKLYQTLSRLTYLESLVHFCAWCNCVRDKEKWQTLEEHYQERTGERASHGICPTCAKKFELAEKS